MSLKLYNAADAMAQGVPEDCGPERALDRLVAEKTGAGRPLHDYRTLLANLVKAVESTWLDTMRARQAVIAEPLRAACKALEGKS